MATYRLLERKEDDLLKHLLRTRGITETEEQDFLEPDYDNHRHDPFLLHDMGKAVERIGSAIKNDEKIVIYSDYDCDGIPGAVILHDFFRAVGFSNFKNHIPHRHYDGFGLSVGAVDGFAEEGVKLLITIDCGTANIEAASAAKERRIDLIITDHHEPKEQLPEAVAVVNPRVGDSYPFPYLCGAAVVFKLVEALLDRGEFTVAPGMEKWWLDMVGLATIGDMVPLRGENRVYASYGLRVLRKSRRPGLQQLLRRAKTDQTKLTEDDIGFVIAPRINAASRMDNPEDAFLMLSATEPGEAGARVDHLEKLNKERKSIMSVMTKELKKRVSEMVDVPPVLVMGNPEWRPALVGLCANSLAEEYKRPVFLWGRDGNGIIKGSCRSGSDVSVVRLMEGSAEHFIEHGGHHASGGFSVKEDSVFDLSTIINQVYKKLGKEAWAQEPLPVDAVLSLDEVDDHLLRTLRSMAPFGAENVKPLFSFPNIKPVKVEEFGKNREHLKLVFENRRSNLEAIAFFARVDQFSVLPRKEEEVTLLAHVEESHFMNRHQVRLRIVDLVSGISV